MTAPNAALLVEPVVPIRLRTDIHHAFETLPTGREAWDRIVAGVGGELYMSYDWCRVWWKHYGSGRQLRVYVFHLDEQIVGLVPMFIETLWLGPLRLRIAKRVGADHASTTFRLPVSPEFAGPVYSALVKDLIERRRCDAVAFGPVPESDPTLDALREACQDPVLAVDMVRDQVTSIRSLLHLPRDAANYMKGLSAGWRQNYRRRLKMLAASFQAESSLVTAPADIPAAFEDFAAQHARQWRALRKGGHFRDWPGAEAFNRELVAELSSFGRLRLHRISAEGRSLAYQYGFVFGDTWYARLPARALDPELQQIGIGVVGLVQLIELLIAEGVRRVEFGSGHYDYKARMGAVEENVRSILVVSSRAAVKRRAAMFLKAADLLHLLYYRIWFIRLKPRFRLPPRPLWRLWIRTRL